MIKIKRVFDEAEVSDGLRILVDGLWPRGISKEQASIDIWMKEIAPSEKLRKWYGHDKDKWEEFRQKYIYELCNNPKIEELLEIVLEKDVTLVFASKDIEKNNAVVLRNMLEDRVKFLECCRSLRDLF